MRSTFFSVTVPVAIIVKAIGLIGLAGLTGCEMPSNPWRFNAPPTTVEANRATDRDAKELLIVVVGRFRDPDHAPNYPSGVGRWMSEAYSRALLDDRRFDVWINPHLSNAVEAILNQPAPNLDIELADLSDQNRDVKYVIVGKVTDFAHTVDLPSDVSRWGVIGRRREAIVAVDLKIVDLRNRRLVGADHLQGVARAGRGESDELYENVAVDSYLFWSTPLGRASKRVIERAVQRTEDVVPRSGLARREPRRTAPESDPGEGSERFSETEAGRKREVSASAGTHHGSGTANAAPPRRDPMILRQHTTRRVSIRGGSDAGLAEGQEYYILVERRDGRLEPVFDPALDLPLRVRLSVVRRTDAAGLLLGKKPLDVDLRGAILRRDLRGVDRSRDVAGARESGEPEWR